MLGSKLLDLSLDYNKKKDFAKIEGKDLKDAKDVVKSYKDSKKKFGDDFDVSKWAESWKNLSDEQIQVFDNLEVGDDILEKFLNSMGQTAEESKSFGAILKDSVVGGLKGIGKSLLGTGLNMLINGAIGAVISGAINVWQRYSNVQENAIAKSNEAVSKLQTNQNKIKSAEEALSHIKENKVIDSSGNEITRFEQLSQGVNSLGENISLTKSEFEEYNSILDAMSNAGLTATTSMAGLEAQVKQIRKSSNIDSLKGLNDWVDGFNAQNNQLYTDRTKEIGYQQKLNALDKIIGKDGKKPQKIDTQSSWDTLSANLAATNELRAAWDSYEGTNAKEHIEKAKKINKDTELKKTETKALKQIAKEYDIDILDDKGNFSYKKYSSDDVQEQLQDARQQMETQVESMVQQSSGFLQALFENSSGFENVSASVSTAIGNIFSNIDYNTVSEHMMDSNGMLSQQMMKDWVKDLSKNVEDKSVQDKISQLFNMDSKSGAKSFVEYKQQALGLVKDISSAVPQLSEGLLKDTTGIGDILDEASSSYNKVVETVGAKFANTLSLDDVNLAADIISKQDIKNAEDLKEALLLSRQAAKDISANPIFDSIKVADESKNAGDDYVSALKYIEEAKEMYDKGLIGTDDFKTRAKYLSPTGSEDPANFIENYSKATRYLTEDSSGVQNFLNDLERKGYATFETLSDGTKKWSYDISDLEGAAENMGMGFEFFMDMFGRLEDYGFSNNFFSTQEEGIEKISEKTAQLAKAKKELAEMETTGQYTTTDDNGNQVQTEANQTAIDAKKAEIAGLENDLNELQNNLETVTQSSIDRINEQIIETKEQYKSLKEERDKILSENRYGENTDEVVAALDEQLKGLAQEGYFEIDGEMNIVNEDEAIEEIESNPVEINVEGNFEELKEQAKESVDVVQKLVEDNNQGVPIKINLDSDSVFDIDTQIAGVMSSLDKLRNENGTINIEAEGAQDAINVLVALIARKQELNEPVIMTADTSNVDASVSSVIGKLQEFQHAYNELERLNTLKSAGVDVDTSAAQAKLDGLASEISNFDGKQAEIIATLGIDPSSSETISASIQSITPEILAKVDPTLVDEYVAEEKKGKGTVEWDNDDSKVRAYASVPKTADGTVTWDNDTTKVKKTFTAQGAITWGNTTPLFGGVASGTMLSPAHADGTANSTPAYVRGNVAIQKDEKALVNELKKPESIVRDGVWSVIPGGAHIEQLKKGDIIFNGEQTEQLLKHGEIAGHGKAYANGTVPNIRSLVSTSLSAYAGGSGGGLGRPSRPSTGMGANNSNRDKNKGNSNKKPSSKKKSSDSSSSASDEAKEFEETLDWIEIKIDRIERKIKNLERVAGSAFETYANRSKALAEQMGKVSYEITVQQQAYERYVQQANSISLSDDYKSQVQNGTIDISTITDEDLKKNIDEYQQWYEKALDCKDAVEELTESVKELYQQAFDNIVEEFDNYISLIEHNKNIIDGYIEQDENAGYLVSTKYYDSLIALENQTLNQLTEERNRLIASLNEAVSSGNVKEYSDAWFKMQQDINDVNEAIQDSTSSLIDYKNAIQEIQWDIFDKIQDRISDINKESDFLIELMSNDKLFDDKGKITDKGKATMGLHGVNYNTYMAQADDYRKEMEKIQKELAEDPHNQTLIDRKRELLDLQREAIQSAEDEKEAIKDLVEEGIEKQLDSLQELIDKYNDTLDSQKDLYDYQKEIAEKQKEIAEIEKQLAAYKGDNSEEGAAKRQELENALAESKDDLAETQYEKSISEQKKLLDELYTEYETILNMRLDNIDMLISDVIANVNSESSGIKDTITSEADKVGYTITDSMNTIWGSNGISGVLTNYSNNFSSTMTGVMTAINDIKNLISKAIEASNNKSQSNISQSQNDQSQQGVEKPSPPPTPPKPTSPQGDGTPNMGDKVVFVSGNYYYDSYGKRPLGHRYQGQEVYITKINPKGSKPYHISRGNKLGDGDLGWVNLEQIKGYKTGVKSVPKSGLYWTNEDAPETIVRKKDNALLTKLNLGDTVLKNSSHNHIWEMATNPTDFIGKYMPKFSPTIPSKYVTTGNNPTEIQINIGIEKVQDYNDFVRQLQADNKFEKLVQSMTIDRIAGKGKLNKYGIKI